MLLYTCRQQIRRLLVPGLLVAILLVLFFWSTVVPKEKRSTEKQHALLAASKGGKHYSKDMTLHLLRDNSVTSQHLSDLNIDLLSGLQVKLSIHSVLDNTEILCHRKLRMGNLGDGGWEVCDDPEVRPRKDDCIVYSFGINNDFSFDDAVATTYGCHVYAFDPSMNAESHNRSTKVHFYKVGISDHEHVTKKGWKMKTLQQLRVMLGHEKTVIDVIKMDIEFSEWLVLPQMITSGGLRQVSQLLLEFHVHPASDGYYKNIMSPEVVVSDEDMDRRRLVVIRDLRATGFKAFYTHKNSAKSNEFRIREFPSLRTTCYEVHYIQRDLKQPIG